MSDWDINREELHELTAAWWLMMLLGVVSVVAGLVVLAKPTVGAIRLVRAFALEPREWNLAVALLQLVAGIVIVSSPHARFATLAVLVGLSLILNGVATAGLGWGMHALRRAAPSLTPSAGLHA
jgi:uncharacterized membrane protein HdeD (DUF308 family)